MTAIWDRNDLREGMHVTATNGKRLGKVIRCDADTFVVEKGMFFPKDYELRYDRISNVGADDATYELSDFDQRVGGGGETTRAALAATAAAHTSSVAAARTRRASEARPAAEPLPDTAPRPAPETRADTGPRLVAERRPVTDSLPAAETRAAAEAQGGLGEHEIHVPLMEEELGVEKVPREVGHLRIRKTVKIEERHFTVPVAREDVVIERVMATNEEPMLPSETAFREQTLDLPLHEEDIRVTKRSRVREEMVFRTVVQAVEKEAAATVRHEEAEVEDTRPASERRTEAETTTAGYAAPGGEPGTSGSRR
jgi:uncharacterized protein (TIGR02271 family)